MLFWVCLFVSVACYAAVAVSPRMLQHLKLRREHDQNQLELVALEQQVEYLEKVGSALEHDPQFAAELARIDFDASRPGDERIPVERSLSLDGQAARLQRLRYDDTLPWYLPLVEMLAGDRRMRVTLLVSAALLTVGAFTCLQEPSGEPVRKRATGDENRQRRAGFRLLRSITARYRKPAGEDHSQVE